MSTLMSLFCNFRWKAHLQSPRKFIFIGFIDYAVDIENLNHCKTETGFTFARKLQKFIYAKNAYVYFALTKLINDKLAKVVLS